MVEALEKIVSNNKDISEKLDTENNSNIMEKAGRYDAFIDIIEKYVHVLIDSLRYKKI